MRDVTPIVEDIDSKLDLLGDFQPFLPQIYSELIPHISLSTLNMSVDALTKSCRPTTQDRAYKVAFWRQLREAEKTGYAMQDARANVLSHAGVSKFVENSYLLSWLLSPEIAPEILAEVRLMELADRLAVLADHRADSKMLPADINYKYLDQQMKMYAMLDKRVNGDYLQRIDQKNMNMHVSSSAMKSPAALTKEDKIKELEQRVASAQTMGGQKVVDEPNQGT